MATERLYYTDAELLEFEANVVDHAGGLDRVVLDRTAFYPTSGGQPHDTGVLGGCRVVDVIDEDERIVHVLDGALELGPVHGEVDAARRRDHMQQHTAQHLISAMAADGFGWETASVHFGDEHSTIEFGTASATAEQLGDLEARANAAVAAAIPVSVGFEEAAAAVARGLRKPPALGGTIRVITIAGLDRSACGGTHVASTAAIGPILLLGVERIRGQVRVGFLAGNRVIARLRAREALIQQLAATLSCAGDELAELVSKRVDELKSLKERVEQLEKELAAARLRALAELATCDERGVRRVVASERDASPGLLRAMAHEAGRGERLLYVAHLDAPPIVLVGSSPDSGIEAGSVLKQALQAVGGRGGGGPRFAQGSVPDTASLAVVINRLLSTG